MTNAKGFTLVELLIVVAIIAILAAIAIPQFSKYRETAAKGVCHSDTRLALSYCAATLANNKDATSCGTLPQSTGSNVSASITNGVISVTNTCSGTYSGTCQYDSNVSLINCT